MTDCTHRIGLYPGTFDPVTYGHLDIIRRASRLVDSLIVAVAQSTGKNTLFSNQERTELVASCLSELEADNITVVSLPGLLVNFAKKMEVSVVFRGLRAVSDFDYEFQMAMMNTRLEPDIETVFLMASENHQFVASRLVKEVARLKGDISTFVPEVVKQALQNKV